MTAHRWWTLHVPGMLVFPLVGLALMWLFKGRRDPVAVVAVLASFVYAIFYNALDILSGIGAGWVTSRLPSGAPRPDEVRSIFALGTPLGEIGSWALLLAAVAGLPATPWSGTAGRRSPACCCCPAPAGPRRPHLLARRCPRDGAGGRRHGLAGLAGAAYVAPARTPGRANVAGGADGGVHASRGAHSPVKGGPRPAYVAPGRANVTRVTGGASCRPRCDIRPSLVRPGPSHRSPRPPSPAGAYAEGPGCGVRGPRHEGPCCQLRLAMRSL